MFPFDERRDNKRRKNPFDFFGADEEFERMFREMERMMERIFRDFPKNSIEPGKSFVHGFNIKVDSDGKPRIEEFGNHAHRNNNGESTISDDREPLTDIMECDDEVAVTVEIPGVEKEDIDLNIKERSLEIDVNAPQRKYHKLVDLPCDVQPKTTKATYKNGILDITIKRKEKKKKKDGYRVNIE